MRSISRRRFSLGAGAALIGLGAARASAADPLAPLRRLLGAKVPPGLGSALPDEAFDAVRLVSGLLALEREASVLQLPVTELQQGAGDIPLDPERFYELAMPRLVALIDRAELASPMLAEQAGELLAKLHGTQHIVAEALGGLRLAAREGQLGPLRLDAGPEGNGLALSAADEPAPIPESLIRATRFDRLAGEYSSLFEAAEIRAEHRDQAGWHLTMMRKAQPRYQALADRAKVPWSFIAAIHGMEASFNFRAHLHNGDFPLDRRTRQVPAGRPIAWLPPSDWESSALDALRLLGFVGQEDWSLPRTLYRLEAFNGFGYRRLGKPSPYLWSFSTLYERGKFVADGHYDARARSQQCGTAVMLKLLAAAGELDLRT